MGSHIRNVIWHLWLRIVQHATGGRASWKSSEFEKRTKLWMLMRTNQLYLPIIWCHHWSSHFLIQYHYLNSSLIFPDRNLTRHKGLVKFHCFLYVLSQEKWRNGFLNKLFKPLPVTGNIFIYPKEDILEF